MAWRGTPRGLRAEFDELLADMQRQFNETMERISGAAQQVPMLGGTGAVVDVLEHEADVVVVVDLPGVDRRDISVRLLDPRTLRVTARREEANEEERPGYHMRERRIGAISRTVALPTDVRNEEATAAFKNGVLEVRLKKAVETGGRVIPVGEEAGRPVAEEERSREARAETEPSGHLHSGDAGEEAQKLELEEQATAERLRKHKEELYEEGKKKLAG